MKIERDYQIEQLIDEAEKSENNSEFPEKTYEQGIIAALRWVYFGDEYPLEGE